MSCDSVILLQQGTTQWSARKEVYKALSFLSDISIKVRAFVPTTNQNYLSVHARCFAFPSTPSRSIRRSARQLGTDDLSWRWAPPAHADLFFLIPSVHMQSNFVRDVCMQCSLSVSPHAEQLSTFHLFSFFFQHVARTNSYTLHPKLLLMYDTC
jgi:hypothetical protein